MRPLLALAPMLALPLVASEAQPVPARLVGVHVGVALAGTRTDHNAPIGPTAMGSVTWRLTPRFGARVQALAARFAESVDHDHAPCASPDLFGCHEPVGPLTVAGAGASLVLADDEMTRRGLGAYYVAGATLHRPIEYPERAVRTRLGWNVGVGTRARRGRGYWTVEVRYERAPRWATAGWWWMAPVTVGLAW